MSDSIPSQLFSVRVSESTGGPSLFQQEGQIAVDVFESGSDLLVLCPMAGVPIDSVDISIHNDVLTVRGKRPKPVDAQRAVHSECFWGDFSRTIVLPVPVVAGKAVAEYAQGMLAIRVPKQSLDRTIPITIVED